MAVKVTVLLNAGAGSIGSAQAEARTREVREALTKAGLDPDVQLCEPARLAETARRAADQGAELVIAGGGDGTVSAVAGGLVDRDVALAVLPLGTLNHFARDLGMPTDLEEAARVIAERRTARIDVAEVNGRVFINNSSIGLYPEIVMSREDQQKHAKRRKWVAFAIAAVRVLRRFPLLSMTLATPDHRVCSKTPFVFIGNNPYVVEVLGLGTRARLDRGELGLYTVRCTGRIKMFWLMVRALLQRLDAVADFEAVTAREAWIAVPRRSLPVAVDGEVVALKSPLHYRIRPSALTVVIGRAAEPAEAEPAPQEARAS